MIGTGPVTGALTLLLLASGGNGGATTPRALVGSGGGASNRSGTLANTSTLGNPWMVAGRGPSLAKGGSVGGSTGSVCGCPGSSLSSCSATSATHHTELGQQVGLDRASISRHSGAVQVHLIDGTYELFRSFYGAPTATGPDGREVGACRGLLRSLLALLREDTTTHMAVAFDHVIESFRNELFAGYKTGEGIDPALYGQFGLAEQVCAALGLVVWPMIEFEADDALATAAARWADAPDVEQVRLCSPDKDLGQCVRGTRVVLVDRRRGEVHDESGIEAKFGVGPGSIPDLLALVGDSADGIPGIPKWGMKSAGAVLSVYRTIDAIPDDASTWTVKVRGAAALAESLASRREQARLYRTLATLRTDVPLPEQSLDELRWRGADRGALEQICEQLGDRGALERVPKWV
jgi:5'-3' exonuclease